MSLHNFKTRVAVALCFSSSGYQTWSAIGKHWSMWEKEEKTKQADTLSRGLLWWFSPLSKTH